MTCEEFKRLSETDEKLSPEIEEAHGNHILTCDNCRREFDELEVEFSSYSTIIAPSGLMEKIITALRKIREALNN